MDNNNYASILETIPSYCLWGKVINTNDDLDMQINDFSKLFKNKYDLQNYIRLSDFFKIECKNDLSSIISKCLDYGEANFLEYINVFGEFCDVKLKIIEENYILVSLEKKYALDELFVKNLIKGEKYIYWIKYVDGRYIKISKSYLNACKKVHNLYSENFIGKTSEEVFNEKSALIEEERRALQGEEIVSVNKLINNIEFSVNLIPMKESENIIGIMGFAIETDDKTMPLNERKKREKRLKAICDAMPHSLACVDKNLELTYANKNYMKKCNGYRSASKESLSKQKKLEEFCDKDKKYSRKVLNEGRESSFEYENTIYDESVKYIEVKKTPLLSERSEVVGVVTMARDITEKKLAEEKLEQIRMEFFSNLSHEFNTPLNVISSTYQLISDLTKNSEDREEYKKYLDVIRRNRVYLSNKLEQIIEATKMDIGVIAFDATRGNIVEFIENAFDNMIDYAKVKDIEMVFDTNEEFIDMFYDEDKIETIVTNLISNAIKFTDEKGTILVVLKKINDYIELHVKDDGFGIKKECLNSIFYKYHRIQDSDERWCCGSGIGLHLVREYVEMHGGTVEVKSEYGRGSEFIVHLPIK